MTVVCIDFETHPFRPLQMLPRPVLAAVADSDGRRVLLASDALDWIERHLRDGSTFVNQSIGFDMGVACAARPSLMPLVFDAYADNRIGCVEMLCQLHDISRHGSNKGGNQPVDRDYRHASVDRPYRVKDGDEDGGQYAVTLPQTYSLQNQARRWLGIELDKDAAVRTTFGQYDGTPLAEIPDAYLTYVMGDLCALDVWDAVWREDRDFSLSNVWALSRRDFALRLIEARGRYTDPVQVGRLTDVWTSRLEACFTALVRDGFVQEKPGPRPKWKEGTGVYSRPTAAKKAWASRWGIPTLTKQAARSAPERVKALVNDYGYYKRPADLPPSRLRFMRRSGLWAEKMRTVRGDPAPTGEWVLKQQPVQDYTLTLPNAELLKQTPTGRTKVTPENVDISGGDATFERIVTYKRADAIRTYLGHLAAGADVPLHVRVNGLAETGRTTSGGGEAGINDQNHRREYGFRECFIPRDGYVFASIDYAQIELCALGEVQYELFGRSALGDAINAGQDCHVVFAAMLLDIEYDDAIKRYKGGDKTLKERRNMAKAFNFGRPGGLAEKTFIQWAAATYRVQIAYSEWSTEPLPGYVRVDPEHLPRSVWVHRIPEDLRARAEADAWKDREGKERRAVFKVPSDPEGWKRVSMSWLARQGDGSVYCREDTFGSLNAAWLRAYPEMNPYLEHVKQTVHENAGRIVQLRSNRMRAGCRFTSAANSMFQGLTADGATEALFRVWRECLTGTTSPLYGSYPVWFVHDEIGLEIPIAKLHDAAFRCSAVMVDTMREFITRVRVEAEPAAMRRWTKGADAPRYGTDGRLIPEEDWRIANDRLTDAEREDVMDFFYRYGLEPMT